MGTNTFEHAEFKSEDFPHRRPAVFSQTAICDQRASTSERAGGIIFFAYGKNRAFPLDCVFNPPRGLAIPYMGNITIFGVQNGTCCVLVLF